ncbi:winged helix DNA-binding domain-containing protein [Flavitalea sp. BT771]|uniref:winged helix DNA-binding domain-containing protein n=1 Tax=Flavitalea sp. BT771 TaxID=3063329 RepID=UPI0026E2EA2C|nr:winged helix DNA-binding domain-containing protein [Flavitalea sp. BT771]MDO6431510.1 winged helix DNA-binding domain-containing protein [Flavitalea sp. BT771]MDV6220418.1 winged helix DNA-binding domain-containing protein [Flavitalea sp. BT771]
MTSQDIAVRRLFSQQMADSRFAEPAGLVKWMGCVRAEDPAGARWSIGARIAGSTDDSIGKAFKEGLILRTHVLQPAWHFIARDDIHWMLALTAPRLKAFNKSLYRSLGLDDVVLKKGKQVIVRALKRGQLARKDLLASLEDAKCPTDDLRLRLLLMDAELDGLICSTSMDGRHFRYTLLEQPAPLAYRFDRAEAIAELTKRYFRSRGPATVYDFTIWSGLRPAEVHSGMQMNIHWLACEVVNGQEYWFDPAGKPPDHLLSLHLLPAFDELTVGYANHGIFKPAVFIDGLASGTWAQVLEKHTVAIQVSTPLKKSRDLRTAIRREAERYSAFLGRSLLLHY